MMNRRTLFFQGIFFGKPRCSCFQGYQTYDPLIRLHILFHRFCGNCKEAKAGGKKRKLAMDSANESMYEDRRNKIPPSFRTNFPLEEEEGGDRLSHSLGISFPKSSLLCRDPRVALFYKEEKKGKKRTRRTSFKNLLKDQRLIYLSLLFGNIFSLNRVLSEGYIYIYIYTLNHDRTKEEVDKF